MDVNVILIVFLAIAVNMTFGKHIEKEDVNDRPIIAVLSQTVPFSKNESYIAASYVKYLESAGARVVPIPHYFDEADVDKLFPYINGVLYPGGGTKWFTSAYYKAGKRFWDLTIDANNKGDYFPLWGTCLGFEAMHVILTDSKEILSDRHADDVSLQLDFTSAVYESKLFRDMPDSLLKAITSKKLTYNHHSKGIAPETYGSNKTLSDFFRVLSTNIDENGKEFISTVEAYQYPIYGVQWHPEKNNFEFTTREDIPHSSNAIKISQYMANFFVDEARKNFHKFPSVTVEEEYMIYRYTPVHSSTKLKVLTKFEQIYVFPSLS